VSGASPPSCAARRACASPPYSAPAPVSVVSSGNGREGEGTDREVGTHAALVLALRDHDDTVLHTPREQDLRGRGAVRLRDVYDLLVIEKERRLAGRRLA
jgi:hypothetical protein